MPIFKATVTSMLSWTVEIEAKDEQEACDRINYGEGKKSAINNDWPNEIDEIEIIA